MGPQMAAQFAPNSAQPYFGHWRETAANQEPGMQKRPATLTRDTKLGPSMGSTIYPMGNARLVGRSSNVSFLPDLCAPS